MVMVLAAKGSVAFAVAAALLQVPFATLAGMTAARRVKTGTPVMRELAPNILVAAPKATAVR